jgi:GT2 family glycosyltransferase
MNRGAEAARGDFLWFLHGDSRIDSSAVQQLAVALEERPEALHYFNLRFLADGPRALRLNEWGVSLRSRILKLPFGDQGYCLSRDLFTRLGGFDECAPYGEDHLFVWAARKQSIPLNRVPAAIGTSGRKYAQQGWARTTARHLWLTLLQAVPEAWRTFKGRFPLGR